MKSLTDKVDELFAEWDKPDSPGCAIGIIQDGKLIYTRGYGMSDLENDIPLTSKSVFCIASTSKQFTAASIVLLAHVFIKVQYFKYNFLDRGSQELLATGKLPLVSG